MRWHILGAFYSVYIAYIPCKQRHAKCMQTMTVMCNSNYVISGLNGPSDESSSDDGDYIDRVVNIHVRPKTNKNRPYWLEEQSPETMVLKNHGSHWQCKEERE